MKRCKSPSAGLCAKPVVKEPGVILTCEDHYPGGICKAKCKNGAYDVVEAVSDLFHFITRRLAYVRFPRPNITLALATLATRRSTGDAKVVPPGSNRDESGRESTLKPFESARESMRVHER